MKVEISEKGAEFRIRGVRISHKRTSVSLENAFWEAVRTIAIKRKISIERLIAEIDRERSRSVNLSSAIRTFVLEHYRTGRKDVPGCEHVIDLYRSRGQCVRTAD